MLYAQGLRRQDIADMLHLDPGTVERHLENIRERLGTRSVAHSIVVSLAREHLELDAQAEVVVLPRGFVVALA
jgi:DNA-binding CsgD family transcriptional regulator